MDIARFDALTKLVGTWTTRRAALALLVGLGLGRRDLADTEARKSGRCKPKCDECEKCKKGDCDTKDGKKRCKKGKCKPKPNATPCTLASGGSGICCGGVCRDSQRDETNCGSCGTVCAAKQVCQAGSCFPSSICPGSTTSLCTPPTPCSPGCSCTRSIEGNVVCVMNPGIADCTGLTSCTNSAPCSPGEACVEVGSCCAGGTPTHACLAACPAPA